jgi:DNA-binding XRE family transcriptional regulator
MPSIQFVESISRDITITEFGPKIKHIHDMNAKNVEAFAVRCAQNMISCYVDSQILNSIAKFDDEEKANWLDGCIEKNFRGFLSPDVDFDPTWFSNTIQTGLDGYICRGLFYCPANNPTLSHEYREGTFRCFVYPSYTVDKIWKRVQDMLDIRPVSQGQTPSYTREENVTWIGKAVASGEMRSNGTYVVMPGSELVAINRTKASQGQRKDLLGRNATDPDFGKVKMFSLETGKAIAHARTDARLFQEQLALMLNIRRNELSMIESGEAAYNGILLNKINKILGTNIKN